MWITEHACIALICWSPTPHTQESRNTVVKNAKIRMSWSSLERTKRFAKNRPNGQEVVEWLGEKHLSSYIPFFLHLRSVVPLQNESDI
jgi:hypothetical protein